MALLVLPFDFALCSTAPLVFVLIPGSDRAVEWRCPQPPGERAPVESLPSTFRVISAHVLVGQGVDGLQRQTFGSGDRGRTVCRVSARFRSAIARHPCRSRGFVLDRAAQVRASRVGGDRAESRSPSRRRPPSAPACSGYDGRACGLAARALCAVWHRQVAAPEVRTPLARDGSRSSAVPAAGASDAPRSAATSRLPSISHVLLVSRAAPAPVA